MSQLQFDYSSHHSDSDCYGSCTLTHVREATPITQLQWNNILSQCIEQWAKYRDIYIYILSSGWVKLFSEFSSVRNTVLLTLLNRSGLNPPCQNKAEHGYMGNQLHSLFVFFL